MLQCPSSWFQHHDNLLQYTHSEQNRREAKHFIQYTRSSSSSIHNNNFIAYGERSPYEMKWNAYLKKILQFLSSILFLLVSSHSLILSFSLNIVRMLAKIIQYTQNKKLFDMYDSPRLTSHCLLFMYLLLKVTNAFSLALIGTTW